MKHFLLFFGLLLMTAVSCSVDVIDDSCDPAVPSSEEVFYAVIDDQSSEPDTKTYADEKLHILWNNDDRVTIFNKSTRGLEYRFTGDDGANSGEFAKVSSETQSNDGSLDKIYAIYPHHDETSIDGNGTITFNLPSIQSYSYGSFGRGANAMVSRSEDNMLRFKNVCGYFAVKLYGVDVSVSSVAIKGNNGESLAGACTIVMSDDGLPVVSMDPEHSSDEVMILCSDPVVLGATADRYTEFWFVLPPVWFAKASGGFTLTVTTPDGAVFEKRVEIDLNIKRNTIIRTTPLEVIPVIPSDEIDIKSLSPNGLTLSPSVEEINFRTDFDPETSTYTMTVPTVTDFSRLVLDYEIADGDVMMVDGRKIVSGVTPIDATSPVTLTVRRGNREKRFTLVARNTGLPVVRITTPGHSQDEITKEDWLAGASIRIENADGTVDLDYKDMVSIKGRGNVSWKYPKKPYSLKFEKKKKVLGMPDHKRWVLLANWKDRTLLRNDAAFWLSRASGLPYTVRGKYVELEYNGRHVGNYYLCEHIKINQNRVNITEMKPGYTDKTGGFLMEIDCYYDEIRKFTSSVFNLKYVFKDPEVDTEEDTTFTAAYNYMENYVNEFERSLKDRNSIKNQVYARYLDVETAILFMFVNEVANNSDFFNVGTGDAFYGPHSTFMYKDVGGKLCMGPVWDFDYGTFVPKSNPKNIKWKGFDRQDYYYYWMCKDPKFLTLVRELWNSKKEGFLGLTDYIDEMADYLRLSEEFDAELWWNGTGAQNQNGEGDLTFQEAVDRMKLGFTQKYDWMDSKISVLYY